MGISKLVEQFNDEVSGAEGYSACAKARPDMRDMYSRMAQAEYEHATMLKQAIDAERSKERTPDDAAKELASVMDSIGKMTDDGLARARASVEGL